MNSKKVYVIHVIVFAFLVFFDQITKYFSRLAFANGGSKDIIPDILSLCFHKNTGAAWSIMSGKTVFLTIFTVILIIFLIYIYLKTPFRPRLTTFKLMLICLLAGAVGNLIDRLAFGYVTDFIYFELIDFPVFNIADCYITITAVLFLIMTFCYFKDDDFDFVPFLTSKKKEDVRDE